MDENSRVVDASAKAEHLCVLVHGLWGNPKHLNNVSAALRAKYPEDELYILAVKRNSGSFTYDGIELGGERVAQEIEDTLEELERAGHHIRKISVVGYSLGGLVARYAIGLLHSKGIFERIQPINFTTFASPHLGVRTPLKGVQNHVWNVLGARLLSMSGRQLFMIDQFRNTERPLLSILADPDSIFVQALAQFKHRTLYSNVVNDRSTVFYTTAISSIDPFTNIDDLKITYVKGYDNVILDPDVPVTYKEKELPAFLNRVAGHGQNVVTKFPIAILLAVLIPIGTVLFLANSGIQTVRSQKRIRLHEEGSKEKSSSFGAYRALPLVRDMRNAVEDVFENINSGQHHEYLSDGSEELAGDIQPAHNASINSIDKEKALAHRPSAEFPTLALTKAQFDMISALNEVGFRKYSVYIHKCRHSHAAIIMRMNQKRMEEGKIVMRHWLEEEFEI